MKRIISHIDQWAAVTLLVMERWKKKPTPFQIELKAAPKTHSQLGYLHSEVLNKLAVALFDAGEIKKNSEREAKYWLKRLLNYGAWIEFDGGLVFDPDSFADASIEVLTDVIDTAIYQASARGVNILPPRGKSE